MAPLPKRRHSTHRSGRRQSQDTVALPTLTVCGNCGKPKQLHRICPSCGVYKAKPKQETTKKDN